MRQQGEVFCGEGDGGDWPVGLPGAEKVALVGIVGRILRESGPLTLTQLCDAVRRQSRGLPVWSSWQDWGAIRWAVARAADAAKAELCYKAPDCHSNGAVEQ